jgi:hypothetical protein
MGIQGCSKIWHKSSAIEFDLRLRTSFQNFSAEYEEVWHYKQRKTDDRN